MNYLANLLVTIGVYAILTMSLDLLVGYTGLLSLGHAAFFGIGAYVAGLAAVAGVNPWLVLPIGALVAAVAAALVAVPALRLRGDYFVLGTFGISMVASSVFENWVGVTGGPYGVFGIPSVVPEPLRAPWDAMFLAGTTLAVVLLVAVLKQRLVGRAFGTTLRAIRDDEVVAESLGTNIMQRQVIVFSIASGMAGLAGALLAFQLGFIEPSLFSFHTTIFVWALLFVGGCGTILGNIVSPAILVLFPEVLRFSGLSGAYAPQVQQALYGVLLIAIAMFRPQGLFGAFRLK